MKIYFNDTLLELPDDFMSVADFLKFKDIPPQGTAIAIDGKLIPKIAWNITKFSPLCRVNVISAAFGG
ncbi:MAG: hypothetical protein J1E95_07900 [Muribaculaceae bacterium]|nr:hypothetical protein [Muribaculaceae bacterium]